MSYQRIQPTEDITRSWAIVRILPNAQHYCVARFYNRQDAQDHLRMLHRFMPASEFEIVFDRPMSKNNPAQSNGMLMKSYYKEFLIRTWIPRDREAAAPLLPARGAP